MALKIIYTVFLALIIALFVGLIIALVLGYIKFIRQKAEAAEK